jgi:hypothetical protein
MTTVTIRQRIADLLAEVGARGAEAMTIASTLDLDVSCVRKNLAALRKAGRAFHVEAKPLRFFDTAEHRAEWSLHRQQTSPKKPKKWLIDINGRVDGARRGPSITLPGSSVSTPGQVSFPVRGQAHVGGAVVTDCPSPAHFGVAALIAVAPDWTPPADSFSAMGPGKYLER